MKHATKERKRGRSLPSGFFAFALVCAPLGHGEVVVRTGFETTDSPAYPLAAADLPWRDSAYPVYNQSGLPDSTRELRMARSPFGSGQYLAVSGPNLVVRAEGITPLSTVVFDLYEPAGVEGEIQFGWANMTDLNDSHGYLAWVINDGRLTKTGHTLSVSGTLPRLSENTHYRIRVVLNLSDAVQSFTFPVPGGRTVRLLKGDCALVIESPAESVLLDGGVYRSRNAASVTPEAFYFRSYASGVGSLLYLDNFSRHDSLEPFESGVAWNMETPFSSWEVHHTGFESNEDPAYPEAVADLPWRDVNYPLYNQSGLADSLRVTRLDNSPFGTGQYAEFGGPNLIVRSEGLTPLSTVSFDFYEPTGYAGALYLGWANRVDYNESNSYLGWQFQDGAIYKPYKMEQVTGARPPSYAVDTHYRIRMLLNHSGVTQRFVSPVDLRSAVSLKHGQAVLYLTDVATGTITDGGTYRTTTDGSILPEAFYFRAYTGNHAYVDNFTRYNTLEPNERLMVWTGREGDEQWTSGGNWQGGSSPMAGDSLVFTSGDSLDTENDLPEGTVLDRLIFNSSVSDFYLFGNEIELKRGVISDSNTVQVMEMDIVLTDQVRFQVDQPNGGLIISGSLKGSGGPMKTGPGELELDLPNEHKGVFVVEEGTVQVYDDQTAADGGWEIGAHNRRDAEVRFDSSAEIVVASGKHLQVGNDKSLGNGDSLLQVDGARVEIHGELILGRNARVELASGSEWIQGGPATVVASGIEPSTLSVGSGAEFVSPAGPPIAMVSGNSPAALATLKMNGGIWSTARGLQAQGGGVQEPLLELANGVIRLTGSGVDLAQGVKVRISGRGEIDTGGHEAILSGDSFGEGTLVKSGSGVLTARGALEHATTIVEQGVLKLTSPGFGKHASVILHHGASMDLDFTGFNRVAALEIDGMALEDGVYDAGTHPSYFSGTGALEISEDEEPGGFAAWAAELGLSGDPEADFDGDGLSDGMEYALAGLDPTKPDGNPVIIDMANGVLSFAKREEAVASGDVSYFLETSSDLGQGEAWAVVTPLTDDDALISLAISTEGLRHFVRLRVVILSP